jgi:hypothetical protein
VNIVNEAAGLISFAITGQVLIVLYIFCDFLLAFGILKLKIEDTKI